MTYVSINPGTVEDAGDSKDFSALVKIISSRYSTSSALFQNSAYEDKIVVQWKFLTVNDKEFSQSYSTGLKVDDGLADISPDGKRLISKSGDFSGFGPKSDATLLIRKAIQAGFPSALVVDDISVFEGHAFFVKDASNPAVSQSRPKPYPKEYKKQGWDLAKNAALEARYAKAAANSSYNPSKGLADAQPGSPAQYNPPQVATPQDVAVEASAALLEILARVGGPVTPEVILVTLNEVAKNKTWDPKFRQAVTFALWDPTQLYGVVSKTAGVKMIGNTVCFK